MNEIERKVDMLISGMKLPKKKTRSRVATLATSLLIAIAIIASASFLSFYVQIDGDVTVEDLLWLDRAPALDKPIIATSVNVVPGCTVIDGNHTIWLNPDYDANPKFDVYLHIEVTENPIPDPSEDAGKGLTVEIWDITATPIWLNEGTPGEAQIILDPGTGTPEVPLNAITFEIRVAASPGINSTSTYGYTITMDWIQ